VNVQEVFICVYVRGLPQQTMQLDKHSINLFSVVLSRFIDASCVAIDNFIPFGKFLSKRYRYHSLKTIYLDYKYCSISSSNLRGARVGAKRLIILPSLLTRNFVKFHFTFFPKRPFVSSVNNLQSG
jgi:hypothetical protein